MQIMLLSSKIAKAEAVVVEPVKWKMSEFVWFKLTSNKALIERIFFSLSAALPYDPFRSVANNWHQYCQLIFRMHQLSHGPFDLVCRPVSAKGFALFTQQDIGQFRKGLELYHELCISGNKIRWKLQLAGFSYDKKSANVVMWKDKEYEYISSAWNNPE